MMKEEESQNFVLKVEWIADKKEMWSKKGRGHSVPKMKRVSFQQRNLT
jgi:hypothetical protein